MVAAKAMAAVQKRLTTVATVLHSAAAMVEQRHHAMSARVCASLRAATGLPGGIKEKLVVKEGFHGATTAV